MSETFASGGGFLNGRGGGRGGSNDSIFLLGSGCLISGSDAFPGSCNLTAFFYQNAPDLVLEYF